MKTAGCNIGVASTEVLTKPCTRFASILSFPNTELAKHDTHYSNKTHIISQLNLIKALIQGWLWQRVYTPAIITALLKEMIRLIEHCFPCRCARSLTVIPAFVYLKGESIIVVVQKSFGEFVL